MAEGLSQRSAKCGSGWEVRSSHPSVDLVCSAPSDGLKTGLCPQGASVCCSSGLTFCLGHGQSWLANLDGLHTSGVEREGPDPFSTLGPRAHTEAGLDILSLMGISGRIKRGRDNETPAGS